MGMAVSMNALHGPLGIFKMVKMVQSSHTVNYYKILTDDIVWTFFFVLILVQLTIINIRSNQIRWIKMKDKMGCDEIK